MRYLVCLECKLRHVKCSFSEQRPTRAGMGPKTEDGWEEPEPAESKQTETDISARSEKAPRVSLWIADVAQAIWEHGEGLGRRMEERSWVDQS